MSSFWVSRCLSTKVTLTFTAEYDPKDAAELDFCLFVFPERHKSDSFMLSATLVICKCKNHYQFYIEPDSEPTVSPQSETKITFLWPFGWTSCQTKKLSGPRNTFIHEPWLCQQGLASPFPVVHLDFLTLSKQNKTKHVCQVLRWEGRADPLYCCSGPATSGRNIQEQSQNIWNYKQSVSSLIWSCSPLKFNL